MRLALMSLALMRLAPMRWAWSHRVEQGGEGEALAEGVAQQEARHDAREHRLDAHLGRGGGG